MSATEAEERAQFTLAMRARGIDDLELLRALERAPRVALHAAALRRHLGARHRLADRLRTDVAAALACCRDDRGARPQADGPRAARSAPEPATHRVAGADSRTRSCRSNAARPWRSRPPRGSPRSGSTTSRFCGADGFEFHAARRALRQGPRPGADRAAGAGVPEAHRGRGRSGGGLRRARPGRAADVDPPRRAASGAVHIAERGPARA